jgi:hypothetical protein
MKTKKILLLSFLLFHVFCILLTNLIGVYSFREKLELRAASENTLAFLEKVTDSFSDEVKTVTRWYTSLSGITGYGFFSPDPPYSYIVYFKLENEEQDVHIQDPLLFSQEGKSRMTSAFNQFKETEREDVKNLMAQSMALRAHELNPAYSKIDLMTLFYIVPSMEDYRKGERPFHAPKETYEFIIQPNP